MWIDRETVFHKRVVPLFSLYIIFYSSLSQILVVSSGDIADRRNRIILTLTKCL